MILKKSRFTEYLVSLNNLAFRRLVFEPGMRFRSEAKWWGDKGPRGHGHSGLDLRLYEDDTGTHKAIEADTKVPIIYEGRIVWSIKDFLGYTVFAAHEIHEGGSRLFSLYGHVEPIADVITGKPLREGTPIATLSRANSAKIPEHLHLSIALIPKEIPLETITWNNLEEIDDIIFFDPMDII